MEHVGHIVGDGIVRSNPKGVAVTQNLPQKPQTTKQLKKILGTTGWHSRRCAPEHPKNAALLSTKVVRKPNAEKPLHQVWDEDCQEAHDNIKNVTRNERLNAKFDKDAEDTILWMDYSRLGIAAVLTQKGNVVRVWGRSCNDAESRHPATKGELKAFNEGQIQFKNHLKSLKHITPGSHGPSSTIRFHEENDDRERNCAEHEDQD